ncbi:protein PFC0760c-like isoform X2 [Sitophilus oryzae]|uniref:Protein PFC0760c-like isoform X2 n=1 Tax=Sitophilus oryzae TaxID=7048 RepID=A0A6J2Y616_SITOR|nr:protein PFC0760c-like isoform X2 [Sitophilus oryzae]
MELSRGICILCVSNTKIVSPPQAQEITSLIKDVLFGLIDLVKFDELNSGLKVCPSCLHDIVTLSKLKSNITEEFFGHNEKCSLCLRDEHLVAVSHWDHFDNILGNITLVKKISKCSVCLDCIKYLYLTDRIKLNLIKKYPHLDISDHQKIKDKLSRSPSKSKSPPSSTSNAKSKSKKISKRPVKVKTSRDIKRLLKHLKPLNKTRFDVSNFKADRKLYNQVAFVRIEVPKNLSRNSEPTVAHEKNKLKIKKSTESYVIEKPDESRHNFFKIKLKPTKKATNAKVSTPHSSNDSLQSDQKKLYVKLLKMDLYATTNVNECNRDISSTNISNEIDTNDNEASYSPKTSLRSTPTKASQKMFDDEPSSSKSRKTVSFSDVLSVEVKAEKKHNINGSPLKSLLKKSSTLNTNLYSDSNCENDDIQSSSQAAEENNVSIRTSFDSDDEDEATESVSALINKITHDKYNDDSSTLPNDIKNLDKTEKTPSVRSELSDDSNRDQELNENTDFFTLEVSENESDKDLEEGPVSSTTDSEKKSLNETEKAQSNLEESDVDKSSKNDTSVDKQCDSADSNIVEEESTDEVSKKKQRNDSENDSALKETDVDKSRENHTSVDKHCDSTDSNVVEEESTDEVRKKKQKDDSDNESTLKETEVDKINENDTSVDKHFDNTDSNAVEEESIEEVSKKRHRDDSESESAPEEHKQKKIKLNEKNHNTDCSSEEPKNLDESNIIDLFVSEYEVNNEATKDQLDPLDTSEKLPADGSDETSHTDDNEDNLNSTLESNGDKSITLNELNRSNSSNLESNDPVEVLKQTNMEISSQKDGDLLPENNVTNSELNEGISTNDLVLNELENIENKRRGTQNENKIGLLEIQNIKMEKKEF